MKIVLSVKNQGPVPTFKNNKRVAINQHNGKSFIMTDQKTKDWMKECIRSFELQLFCATRIGGGATLTAPLPHSSIASLLPLDDSWTWCPEINIRAELCEKGCEGATITIERIYDTGERKESSEGDQRPAQAGSDAR